MSFTVKLAQMQDIEAHAVAHDEHPLEQSTTVPTKRNADAPSMTIRRSQWPAGVGKTAASGQAKTSESE